MVPNTQAPPEGTAGCGSRSFQPLFRNVPCSRVALRSPSKNQGRAGDRGVRCLSTLGRRTPSFTHRAGWPRGPRARLAARGLQAAWGGWPLTELTSPGSTRVYCSSRLISQSGGTPHFSSGSSLTPRPAATPS